MTDGCEGMLNDALNCGKCAEKAGKDEHVACNRDERRVCGYNYYDMTVRECACEQPEKEEDGYVAFCPYSNMPCVNLKKYNMYDCFACANGFSDENGDLAKESKNGEYEYGKVACARASSARRGMPTATATN